MPQEADPNMDRVTTRDKSARAAAQGCTGVSLVKLQPACRVALHREQGPRDSLEDAVGWVTTRLGDQSLTVLAVCDGVGGQQHGEVAAELALRELCALLLVLFALGHLGDRATVSAEKNRRAMLEAVAEANRVVVQRARDDPSLRGMACTCVLVALVGDRMHVCWAGDSRCYLARGNRLEQITRDHRLHAHAGGSAGRCVSEVLNAHTITQCLGNAKGFAADYACRDLRDGDLILVCTDGLTDALTDEEIARHVAAWRAGDCTLDDLPRRLAADALDAGASDNVTVLCCAYEDSSSVAPDSETPTRTVAYPAALAASLTLCMETDHD